MLSSQGSSSTQATASGSSANSGACTLGAEQEGHIHPASAPSFLQVSQDSISTVLLAQRSFANLAHSQSNISPVEIDAPVSPDAGGSMPVKVSSALPPIPSYLPRESSLTLFCYSRAVLKSYQLWSLHPLNYQE